MIGKVIGCGFLAVLLFAAFMSCASTEPAFDEKAWLERVNACDPSLLYAPHRDENGNFFNPWMLREDEQPKTGFFTFLFRKKIKFGEFPREEYAPLENKYAYLSAPDFDSISFAGHASMIIKIDGVTILTDPFFSNRALTKSKEVKIPFDFSQVSEGPVVLMSHNHYDHLDKQTIKELVKKNAVFVVALNLKNYFEKLGAEEVYELDWWQSIKIGTVNYTLLPAQHWSRRIGQANNTTLWGGFLIEASKTFYFSGDTGFFVGFKEFGKRWNIDYAIIGAGAYEPRRIMHYQHLNIAEFLRAVDDLNAKTAIPMHFGTISLSDEPLVYPLYELDLYLREHPGDKDRIRPLRVGEYLEIK